MFKKNSTIIQEDGRGNFVIWNIGRFKTLAEAEAKLAEINGKLGEAETVKRLLADGWQQEARKWISEESIYMVDTFTKTEDRGNSVNHYLLSPMDGLIAKGREIPVTLEELGINGTLPAIRLVDTLDKEGRGDFFGQVSGMYE